MPRKRDNKIIDLSDQEELRLMKESKMLDLTGGDIPCGRCGKPGVVALVLPSHALNMFGWDIWSMVASCAECICMFEDDQGQADPKKIRELRKEIDRKKKEYDSPD